MLTYDVDIWSVRYRKDRRKPYELRWQVGGRAHSKSYRLKTQAEGRSSELLSALRGRQQFDTDTGLPAKELAALRNPTWYQHAQEYALMKWPGAAAKHRASIAETLAIVTAVQVTTSQGGPDHKVLRRALYSWAFRAAIDSEGSTVPRASVEEPPQDIRDALKWIAEHSLKIDQAAEPEKLRPALNALSRLLDGKPAAENTVRRKRMVLNNAWRFAVEEKGHVPSNPLRRVDWQPPPTTDEVDFRYVPGPRVARDLIAAVGEQGNRGAHLRAFFGCLYYAAMRPAEIASLKCDDCHLPPEGSKRTDAWGELVLEESRPEVGAGWTDTKTSYDKRGLKRRARRATRSVPIPPVLVRMLREHMQEYGVAEDGRLFRAARGGRVRSNEYVDLWEEARVRALTTKETRTKLADVPYSLRHAGVSLWIKVGVDPAEVAERAGHSVAVLYRFYAKLLRGNQNHANALIDVGLSMDD